MPAFLFALTAGVMSYQRRSFDIELRAAGDDSGKLVGYAAVFDQETQLYRDYFEVVRPGAFTKTIQESDVRALWNHDDNHVLGRSKSGTLTMSEDDKGLRVEIDPPDTQWANDLRTSIKRGDIDQMSFGFTVVKDEERTRDDGTTLRELQEVRLFDVSPVTFPAYEQTEIQARSLYSALSRLSEEQAERLFREAQEASKTDEREPVPADHSRLRAAQRRLQIAEATI